MGAPLRTTKRRTQCAIGFSLRRTDNNGEDGLRHYCAVKNRVMAQPHDGLLMLSTRRPLTGFRVFGFSYSPRTRTPFFTHVLMMALACFSVLSGACLTTTCQAARSVTFGP